MALGACGLAHPHWECGCCGLAQALAASSDKLSACSTLLRGEEIRLCGRNGYSKGDFFFSFASVFVVKNGEKIANKHP